VWAPMKDQGGGVIVNTGSGFGGGAPGLAAYMAAKAGVFALTRDTAFEGAEHSIRCNALMPAARTRMSVPYWGADQTEHWDLDWATTLAMFLASALSDGITGRQFSLTPGNVIRETFVDNTTLVSDEAWTPESLARRIQDVLHHEPAAPGLRLPTLATERTVSRP
jgi:NAD(P)-dependent dehydrogenase (short-subunit alcohol dehydrogenase family)